jgi:anti-sigma regulatory factor (Ser/Thr protein kinase)
MSYWSRSFRGIAECLSEVRLFTAAVLGDRPGVDLVVLAASELAGNAILHTASGEPGGQFVVHIAAFADRWQVRVDDAGGMNIPHLPEPLTADADPDPDDCEFLPESGRGLALVAAVSRTWGVLGDEYSRAVWAEIPHPRTESESVVVSTGGAADSLDAAVAAMAADAEIEDRIEDEKDGDADGEWDDDGADGADDTACAGSDADAQGLAATPTRNQDPDSPENVPLDDPAAYKRYWRRRIAAAMHADFQRSLIEIAYAEAFGWPPPEGAIPTLVEVAPSPSGTNLRWVGVSSDGR